MIGKDLYNHIITIIEDKVTNSQGTPREITESIEKLVGFSAKDINAMLSILTGKGLKQYIKDRQMMAAYRVLLDSPKFDVDPSIVLSGYDNQSSFTNKFTSVFGISPKKAFQKKDKSLYVPPLEWSQLSEAPSPDTPLPCLRQLLPQSTEDDSSEEYSSVRTTAVPSADTHFGIPTDTFTRIKKAMDLQAFYQLSDTYSDTAFALSEQFGYSLERTFLYMDQWNDYLNSYELPDPSDEAEEADDEEAFSTSPSERLHHIAFDPVMLFGFFECHLSITLTFLTAERIPLSDEEFCNLSPDLVYEFANSDDICFDYFKVAFDYFIQHADKTYCYEDLANYIDDICAGDPKEIAFSNLIPINLEDEDYTPDSLPSSDDIWTGFEDVEREEDEWRGVRIDQEYDEENLAYELDDIESASEGLFS